MKIDVQGYRSIVMFTGAGMSAESGVPTYRGKGGVWDHYDWTEYACQSAWERNPEKVLKFHELRRAAILECRPHRGHRTIADIQKAHPHVVIITQNIDGMHQRAGSVSVSELHGNVWRVRCPLHGVSDDVGSSYRSYHCQVNDCSHWLRPDITWFNDTLNIDVINQAVAAVECCDLFISVGTSGVVWPAAGFPGLAKENGSYCLEINPEPSDLSYLYDRVIRQPASAALAELFG